MAKDAKKRPSVSRKRRQGRGGLRKIAAPPLTEQAWRQLTSALARALIDMEEDEYLVISAKATGAFVQFA